MVGGTCRSFQWKLNSLVYKRMSAKEFAIGIDYDDKSSDWLIDDGKEYSGGSSAWMLSLRHVCSDYHFILHNGQYSLLTVMSAGHSLHVFINGQLAGTVSGSVEDPRLTYTGNVKLWAGSNRIAILSISVGLPNVGEHFEKWNAGVFDLVTLDGLNEGRRGLSWQKWTYQNGLKGESLSLNTLSGSSSVDWQDTPEKQPLTWYKAFFNAPGGSEPLALDMSSMGKGQVQISG